MGGGAVVSHGTGGQKLAVDVVPGKVMILRDGVADWSGQNVTVVGVPSVGKTVTNGDGTPLIGPNVPFGAELPVNVLSGVVVLVEVLDAIEFEDGPVLLSAVWETPPEEAVMPEADVMVWLLLVVVLPKGGVTVLSDLEWADDTDEP